MASFSTSSGVATQERKARRAPKLEQSEKSKCRKQKKVRAGDKARAVHFFGLIVRAERPRGSRARCAGARAPRLCARAALGVVRVHLAYGVVPRGATLVRSVERACLGARGRGGGVSRAGERGTARRRVLAAALRGM